MIKHQIVTAELSNEKIISFYINIKKTTSGVKITLCSLVDVGFPKEILNWYQEMSNNLEDYQKEHKWQTVNVIFCTKKKLEIHYKTEAIAIEDLEVILRNFIAAGFPKSNIL